MLYENWKHSEKRSRFQKHFTFSIMEATRDASEGGNRLFNRSQEPERCCRFKHATTTHSSYHNKNAATTQCCFDDDASSCLT
jgi:hypothetical protein